MKRTFSRTLALILIVVGVGVGSQHPAQACYCMQTSQAFTSSDTVAVVIGQVVCDMDMEGAFSATGLLTIELSDVYRSGDLVSPVRVHTAVDTDGNVLAPTVGSSESSSVAESVRRFQSRWWIVPFVLIGFGVILRLRQREVVSPEPKDPADD